MEQAVITLRIKEALLVKPCPLELMIHISRDHKVILIRHQFQKLPVYRLWSINIAVVVDMPCPPRPARFIIREWVEASGIHITDAKLLRKIEEIPFKPLAAVGQARGGR